MADDIASLGFAIDSAPLTQGALALKSVADSGKAATTSSKEFASSQTAVVTATRQAANETDKLISENVKLQNIMQGLVTNTNNLVTAVNDNTLANNALAKSTESVSNTTKAANDNIKKSTDSNKSSSASVKELGISYYDTGKKISDVVTKVEFLGLVALKASPALRGMIDVGVVKTLDLFRGSISTIPAAVDTASKAVSSKLNSAFSLLKTNTIGATESVVEFHPVIRKIGEEAAVAGNIIKTGLTDAANKVAPAFTTAGNAIRTGFTDATEKAAPVIRKVGVEAAAAGNVIKTGLTDAVAKVAPAFALAGNTISNSWSPAMKILGAASIINLALQFKLASAAAYVLIPSLRAVVDEKIIGGLKSIAPAIGAIKPAAGAAVEALGPRLVGGLLAVARFALPILAIDAAYKALMFSVELAGERIEKSNELIEKSTKTGLGITMLQRIDESAKKVGSSVDSMTESMKKFFEVTQNTKVDFAILEPDKKRGKPEDTEFKTRLNELIQLGNFANNQFVEAFNKAATTEERYRAVVGIITKAMNQGERLAALNLGSMFLSDGDLKRLQAFPEFLDRAKEAADKISRDELISPQQVAYALRIKEELDAAQKILKEKWIPFQDILVATGLKLKLAWSGIVFAVASVLDKVTSLPSAAADFVSKLASAVPYSKEIANTLGALKDAVFSKPEAIPGMAEARQQLTEGLLQPDKIKQAAQELMNFYTDLSRIDKPVDQFKKFNESLLEIASSAGIAGNMIENSFKLTDLRKNFDEAKKAAVALFDLGEINTAQFDARVKQLQDAFDAAKKFLSNSVQWDREASAISRHTAVMQADAASIGQSEKFHEQLRGEMQLLEAAERGLLGVTQEQIDKYAVLRPTMSAQSALQAAGITLDKERTDQMIKLAEASGEAKQSLVALTAQDKAYFEGQIVFLSDIDKQIASIQKSIHGNAWKDFMNDGLSATLRLNEAMKVLESTVSSFVSGFATDLSHGVKAVDALKTALVRLSDTLIKMASEQLVKNALGGLGSGGLANLLGIGGGTGSTTGGGAPVSIEAFVGPSIAHGGGVIGQSSFPSRYIHPAYFDDAPRFHQGLFGDEFPAILQRGEKVIPKGAGSGMGNVNVVVQNYGSEKATTKQSTNSDGSKLIEIIIGEVGNRLAKGTFDPAMSRYGAKPVISRR